MAATATSAMISNSDQDGLGRRGGFPELCPGRTIA